MQRNIRVIARLDVKGPNLIKGIQLDGYRALGHPERFAEKYYAEGVDEIIFQDVVASLYQRNNLLEVVSRVAERVFVPLTVAGGIRSVDDARAALRAGADKVAVNTAAIERPELIREIADAFGSQCIVASLEAYRHENGFVEIWTNYGRQQTGVDAIRWADKVCEMGAGEILLTSINREGTGRGYDSELVAEIARNVSVPVIAAGGAGNKEHLIDVATAGHADAVCAASIFHYGVATPVDGYALSFSEKRLRLGEEVDSGNIDFLNFGYGGYNAIPVKPTSLSEAKSALSRAGFLVRQAPEVALHV
jgi:cyclase